MFRTFLLVVVVALSPIVARADQITGGIYRFSFTGTVVETHAFGGANFSVNAVASTNFGISLPAFFGCSPCVGGSTVSLSSSAFLDWADWNVGTVVVNGVSHPVFEGVGLGANSQMTFLAGSVVLPETSDPSITLSLPFSVSSGGIFGPGYGVNFTYSGGLASVTYNRIGTDAQGHTIYGFNQLVYGFQPIQTPEPATIALMVSGLLALPFALRRRKK